MYCKNKPETFYFPEATMDSSLQQLAAALLWPLQDTQYKGMHTVYLLYTMYTSWTQEADPEFQREGSEII